MKVHWNFIAFVSFLSAYEGDGHYRAAGPHVFHQLLEEVPQHHLWTSPYWSAAKCEYYKSQSQHSVEVLTGVQLTVSKAPSSLQ